LAGPKFFDLHSDNCRFGGRGKVIMNRRDFVGKGIKGLAGAWAASNLLYGADSKASSKYNIAYMRNKAPDFQVPAYRGQWYDDTVPDTLDLAERLRLAVHASTAIADPQADGEVFWVVDFLRNPPVMIHDFNDWVLQLEGLLEGVPLGRTACGSTENEDIDQAWMENWVLKALGPDGMLYIPMGGRPWGRQGVGMPGQRAFRPNGTNVAVDDPSVEQITSAYTCQRVMPAMTLYYMRDKNPMWKASIDKMVSRLNELAIKRDNYAYYPDGVLEPGATYGSYNTMPTSVSCVEWGGNGRLIQALAQYSSVTGSDAAMQLAEKLTNYMRLQAQYYAQDGTWLMGDLEKGWLKKLDLSAIRQGGHGHAHTIGLLSVLEYALAANDKEAIRFARAGFDWGVANGTRSIGFFREFYVPGYHTCETDTISDLLGMAVKMSVAGVADYWDDIDRWVRNQFVEQQLTSTEWVYTVADRLPKKPVKTNETSEKVAERNLGAFAGWAAPNDFTQRNLGQEASIMHCCMGNGTRAMYYVWEHIVTYKDKDEDLRLNLLMNHASPWADVYSHIPYEGKVEVKAKKPMKGVVVRVPEWVESGSPFVKATRGGNAAMLVWEGRSVRVGPVATGDVVTVTFPIFTRTVKENISSTEYTMEIRGNTVVSMTPGGQNGPLYRREHMKADKAPTTKVKRFVTAQPLLW